jgi:hypothetical protein
MLTILGQSGQISAKLSFSMAIATGNYGELRITFTSDRMI